MSEIKAFNRKVILELRYDHVPLVIDRRGDIVNQIIRIPNLNCNSWRISNDSIEVFDSEIQNEVTKRVFISTTRLAFIDEYSIEFATIKDSFLDTFKNIVQLVNDTLSNPTIRRVGCRIIGSYQPSSGNSGLPLKNFLKVFNDDIFIKDFPVRDVGITISYSSGRYFIGPLRKNDKWIADNFKHGKTVNKEGFAIDTDNFIVDNNNPKGIKQSEISNIYDISLQVEETLFQNLSKIYG